MHNVTTADLESLVGQSKLLQEGKSTYEVAIILATSENNVWNHLFMAFHKKKLLLADMVKILKKNSSQRFRDTLLQVLNDIGRKNRYEISNIYKKDYLSNFQKNQQIEEIIKIDFSIDKIVTLYNEKTGKTIMKNHAKCLRKFYLETFLARLDKPYEHHIIRKVSFGCLPNLSFLHQMVAKQHKMRLPAFLCKN